MNSQLNLGFLVGYLRNSKNIDDLCRKTRQSIMIYSDLLGTSTLFLRILEGVFPCFSSVRSFEIKPTSLVIFFQRFIPY